MADCRNSRAVSVALVLVVLAAFPLLAAGHNIQAHAHQAHTPVTTVTSAVQTHETHGNGLPRTVEEVPADKRYEAGERAVHDRSSHQHHDLHREFHRRQLNDQWETQWGRPGREYRASEAMSGSTPSTETTQTIISATSTTTATLRQGGCTRRRPRPSSSPPIIALLPSFILSSTPSAVASVKSTSTQSISTSVNPSGTVQIVPSVTSSNPNTTGSLPTSLESKGRPTSVPFVTSSIPSPTSLISAISPTSVVASSTPTAMVSADIFAAPIATAGPPSNIGSRSDHPVPRQGIIKSGPIETNKFYANMFLGTQSSPTYLHPYSVAWAKGAGSSGSWGLAISQIDASQRVYGPTANTTGAASYFLNPVGIQSMVISALELNTSTVLTTESPLAFSVNVQLRANAEADPAVQFPLVQGQAFITAIYNGSTPLIQTGVFFKTVTRSSNQTANGATKYTFALNDGTTWLLYAYSTSGSALDLQVINDGNAEAQAPFYGVIQIAKDPGNAQALYDATSGAYPTGVELSGTANGATGTYTLSFTKGGLPEAQLLMFALPHHLASFDAATAAGVIDGVNLQTTTKGIATAVVADSWTMVESLPVDISFYPWLPGVGSKVAMSNSTRAYVQQVAQEELSQNMAAQTDVGSIYYDGKALAKFANIIMVLNDMVGNTALAQAGLLELKTAFALFTSNQQQQYPLVYESAWGGVVETASYVTGNDLADFGNTYYNDHHFHYGYFIYTAAVIGHLDPSWIANTTNRDYVNLLVRDIANPSSEDPYFPVSRMFDWFHGHSWAHGLYETADGKDQESSSEDTMHSYAIKMWGQVIGDANMAARGNLQLAVQQRSLNSYYLYNTSNTVEPSVFISNRVAGILFENKIDHTTYFGTNIEYIQGIHMLPLLAHTPFIRGPQFVTEEWDELFTDGRADVAGGWRGILYGNYATIDPSDAFAFFNQSDFDMSYLDGGASLTWYLAYSAALAGL